MKAKTTASTTNRSASGVKRGRNRKDHAPQKQGPAPEVVASVERMGQLCQEMQAAFSRIQQEMAQLQDERDHYLKALHTLTYQEFDLDKESLLAQISEGPPLEEFIAELESQARA